MILTSRLIELHYNWLVKSPTLFDKGLVTELGYEPFLFPLAPQQIDFDELAQAFRQREQNNRKQHYHLPLGKYAETIFVKHFDKDNSFEFLQQNVQIKQDNRTIGEVDFILKKDKKIIHCELAVKFYLLYKNPSNPSHWIGPNAKDNLANKLEKNINSFNLTRDKKFKHFFPLQPTNHEWLIKGCWFYNPTQDKECFPFANINGEHGVWLHKHQIEQFVDAKHHFYEPSKIEWIASDFEDKTLFNKEALKNYCSKHFYNSQRALMFWNINTQQRLCIVANNWPNL